MNKFSNSKNGFTIVEVLVSLGIVLIFLPFAAGILVTTQYLASYSKHKAQAAYAAKQIIEMQRQQPQPVSYFAPKLATQNPVNTSTTKLVALDTKGNFNNSTNYFYGTAVITVSPPPYVITASNPTFYTAVYTPPNNGAPITYYTVAHVGVQITWSERIFNTKVPIKESYATDIIVNDSMFN